MLTLTAASKETKLILKWAGIVVAAIFVLILAYRALVLLKETFFPTPPPKPTIAFGKLPAISFPTSAVNENYKYSLDTISGKVPLFKDQIKIYEIEKPKADLLALKKIGQDVKNVGFENGPFKVSDDSYFWTNSSGQFLKTIRVNIKSRDFTLFSPFYFQSDVLSGKNLPKQADAVSKARDFLYDMNYPTGDLDTSKTRTILLSVKDGQLLAATSQGSTRAYRINFYQKDINNLPIFYGKPIESNINLIVTGGTDGPQIVRANYSMQRVSGESSTYPIKTSGAAFEELKEGKAYIASYYGAGNSIKIKDIFLAYYMGEKEQDYLYPIVVFEGNDGFLAYLPAVTDEWISK